MLKNAAKCMLILLVAAGPITMAYASVEEELSAIERYQYTSEEFKDVVNIIKYYHPRYSRKQIGRLIVMAYYELQEHFRDVSLYEVAQGIKSISRQRLGIDLESHIVTYMNAKIKK